MERWPSLLEGVSILMARTMPSGLEGLGDQVGCPFLLSTATILLLFHV